MTDEHDDSHVPSIIKTWVNRRLIETADGLKLLIERNKDRIDRIDDQSRKNEQEIILLRGEMRGGFEVMRETQKRYHDEQMEKLDKISAQTFEPLKEFLELIQTPAQREAFFGAIRQTIKRTKKREELGDEAAKSAIHWGIPLVLGIIGTGLLFVLGNYLDEHKPQPTPVIGTQYFAPGSTANTPPATHP